MQDIRNPFEMPRQNVLKNAQHRYDKEGTQGIRNDPARFIGKVAATEDGETAKIHNYLDTEKIEQEALYDGMYAVTTDLLDDDVKDILKVSEGRWNIMPIFQKCRFLTF